MSGELDTSCNGDAELQKQASCEALLDEEGLINYRNRQMQDVPWLVAYLLCWLLTGVLAVVAFMNRSWHVPATWYLVPCTVRCTGTWYPGTGTWYPVLTGVSVVDAVPHLY